jgi:hypothetical protein
VILRISDVGRVKMEGESWSQSTRDQSVRFEERSNKILVLIIIVREV